MAVIRAVLSVERNDIYVYYLNMYFLHIIQDNHIDTRESLSHNQWSNPEQYG